MALISRKREQRKQVRAEQEKRKQEEEQKQISSESLKNTPGSHGAQSQCGSQPPTPGHLQPDCEEPETDQHLQYSQSGMTCKCYPKPIWIFSCLILKVWFLFPAADGTLDSGQGSSVFSETHLSQVSMSYGSPATSQQPQVAYPPVSQAPQQHTPYPQQPMVSRLSKRMFIIRKKQIFTQHSTSLLAAVRLLACCSINKLQLHRSSFTAKTVISARKIQQLKSVKEQKAAASTFPVD